MKEAGHDVEAQLRSMSALATNHMECKLMQLTLAPQSGVTVHNQISVSSYAIQWLPTQSFESFKWWLPCYTNLKKHHGRKKFPYVCFQPSLLQNNLSKSELKKFRETFGEVASLKTQIHELKDAPGAEVEIRLLKRKLLTSSYGLEKYRFEIDTICLPMTLFFNVIKPECREEMQQRMVHFIKNK